MSKSRLSTSIACLLAVAGLAACGSSSNSSGDSSKKSGPITIGFVIGKTGVLESYDIPAATAAKYAIADINKAGGVDGRQIKTVEADMKSKPELAGTAATDVISKGADILITPCDFDLGSPAAIQAQKAGKIGISTCAASTNFGPQGVGDLAYTMGTAGVTEGAAAAEWAYDKQKYRSAYLLWDNTLDQNKQASAAFKTRWQALGGKLVGEDTFKQDDQSIAAQVTRIKQLSTKPDFIYMSSYQPGFAKAIKQVRAAGIDSPIVGGSDLDGDYWKSAVPNLSNVFFTAYASIYGDDPNPKVNELVSRYTQQAGKKPDVSAFLTGYATVQAIVEAIKESGGSTDGKTLTAKMQAFSAKPFLLKTTFTPQWHISLKREVRILKIEGGKTSTAGTWNAQDVPTPKG
ncbi:MAG TPA: ABC transporter substrate-binding protein [Solirubrobacteraceae bacterium]|nr:ABC transporter substrate-binding protein [Solirubrobacteraceae bacterium]